MEFFYEVYVASNNYHGSEALTYSSATELRPGQMVRISLRNALVMGIVKQPAQKPKIKIKPLEPLALPPLPGYQLELLAWLADYYPAPFGSIVQLFVPGLISPKMLEKFSPLTTDSKSTALPELTFEQKEVISKFKWQGTNFLHGETGSGKTRVYQELALKTISEGKSAVILSPEIGLSSQLFENFYAVFGKKVKLFHSNLTPAEKRRIWLEALTAKEPMVIVGARSALFLPLRKIGLIVVDEAHDSAYKQEQAPYYHAIRVAGKLAQLNDAALILGTATPNVTDYYIASQRKAELLRLSQLAISHPTPVEIEVVDLKNRGEFTRSHYLSESLLKSMELALSHKEQVLLFLNRRGTARAVMCQSCGWQALCPQCDTPLIYHGDNHTMICHICNYRAPGVSSCPVCSGVDILFKSAGTKGIVEEVNRLFPAAKVQRFDADNLKSERFEQNYQNVRNGEVDILVGTQTLAKGLDLPRLSLVGVITADSGLFIPDYLAQERTYQLISQVIGRVGRGHRNGKVVIQTYAPESLIIKNVLKKNWANFYEIELRERKQFRFPPFYYLLKVSCRRASSVSAQKTAGRLATELEAKFPDLIINGPAPAFHEKQGDKYEWQLIIKSKNRRQLTEIINDLPSGWTHDIEPLNLL